MKSLRLKETIKISRIWLIILALAICFVLAKSTFAVGEKCYISIDATQTGVNPRFNDAGAAPAGIHGQTFTAVASTVCGFQFKIGTGDGIHGEISVNSDTVLYDVSNETSVEQLARKTFSAPISGVTDFFFDAPVSVTIGNMYFIGIDTTDSKWGLYQICDCNCSCYDGGSRANIIDGQLDGGTSGEWPAGRDDYYFVVYSRWLYQISADSSGTPKDNFAPQEHVYGKTSGLFLAVDEGDYPLHVVDTKVWTTDDNQTIPSRKAGAETTIHIVNGDIQKDASGTAEDIWVSPPPSETAQYDIVVDINKDGNYDPSEDLLDYENGVGYGFSLPVEFSSFTATTSDGTVTLRWRTESEVNNIGFAVYRSDVKDGQYIKIGWVDGAGNSAMPHDYQFLDKQVETGKTYFYYIEDVDIAGERNKSDIIQITLQPHPQAVIPAKFALLQNYPNPFNPETWIPYWLAKDAHVTIIIHNARGQTIRILDLGAKQAGEYVIRTKAAKWDGRDDLGEKVASGVYFYILKAGEFSATRKMLIVK